jgi:starch synthase (maltosyl-transferring)
MGFDVLYLPPIHPIGRTMRKGRNNTLTPRADDLGSPWAIGAAEGGHDAVHPALGTLEDFRRLVAAAARHDIEVALDIAFQCAPDHPWVRDHPQWFRQRADGTIQYAENPPKKYQDVYPFDFECDDWRALWRALAGVMAFWADQGVKIFRVDNPHTKAFGFWEWAIAHLRAEHPDLIFLAEAFTRPKVMHRLAKLGFSQSYTYFTWRNTKRELTDYFTELAHGPGRETFRPNVWPNTPDILPAALQYGGRPVFMARVALAATLAASYGIYGPAYELLEDRALREGGEEYLDSEKYERRVWDRARADSLADFVACSTPRGAHTRRCSATTGCVSCRSTTSSCWPTGRPRPTAATSSSSSSTSTRITCRAAGSGSTSTRSAWPPTSRTSCTTWSAARITCGTVRATSSASTRSAARST